MYFSKCLMCWHRQTPMDYTRYLDVGWIKISITHLFFFHGVLCSNRQTIYSLGVPEMIFCGWNPERIYQHLKQEYKRRQSEKSVETGMLWSVLDLSYPNLLGARTLWECPSALAAAGGKWRGKALNDGAGWMLSSHI